MFISETKIRVRYAETDQMGYVYYGNYAQYYEVARVEALRDVNLSYKLFEEQGIMMPVLHLSCKYIEPALYDDLLTIKTIIKKMPGIRIEFLYEIYNEQGILLNQGETTLVCMNMKTQRPCQAPISLMNALASYFN